MKLVIILILLSISLKSEEKLDSVFNNVPEKLNSFEFKFPEYKIDYLKNGINLYLVPDDAQLITNIRVLIGNDVTINNSKPGVFELTTGMMLKGTKTKKANEISEAIDFYGANVSFNTSNEYIVLNISVLNKYLKEVVDIVNDVLFNVEFDKKELEKMKKQYVAAITSEKSDPGSLAGKLSRKVIFGDEHLYSKIVSEKDIEKIEVKDLKTLHKELFIANNVSLGIYGYYKDSDLSYIFDLFNKFEKKELNDKISLKTNYSPGVYFIEREGSVQSSIRIISPAPEYSEKEYEKLQFASNVIGSGFIGRLFKTLREKHSYTYSPSAAITSNKYDNYFSANADVKAEVTDSAISVMLEILEDMVQNEISNEELEAVKNFRVGNYYMAFENSDYTISLIQNSEFKGKRAKLLESFDSRIKGISSFDVKKIVNDFLNKSKLSIVVVGPKEVKAKLEKFGKVQEYTKEIAPLTDFKKIKMDYDDVFEKFLESIGGDDIFDDVKSLKVSGDIIIDVNGQEIKGEYLELMKGYNLKYSMQDLKINKQESIFKNGINYIKVDNQKLEEPIKDFDKINYSYYNFAKATDKNYKINVLGERDNKIFISIESNGENRVYQFDNKTFKLMEFSASENTPMGKIEVITKYESYFKVGVYEFPTMIKIQSNMFNSTLNLKYEVNTPIEDGKFEF